MKKVMVVMSMFLMVMGTVMGQCPYKGSMDVSMASPNYNDCNPFEGRIVFSQPLILPMTGENTDNIQIFLKFKNTTQSNAGLEMPLNLSDVKYNKMYDLIKEKYYKWKKVCIEKNMEVQKVIYQDSYNLPYCVMFVSQKIKGKLCAYILFIVGSPNENMTAILYDKDIPVFLGHIDKFREGIKEKYKKMEEAKKKEEENEKNAELLD